MSQSVIEVDNADDEALLIKLLPRLNARLINRQQPAEQRTTFVEIAAQGGVADRLAIRQHGNAKFVVGIGYLMVEKNDFRQ